MKKLAYSLITGLLVVFISSSVSAEVYVLYTFKVRPNMQSNAVTAMNAIQDYEKKKWGHKPITMTPGDGDVEATVLSLDRHNSMGEYETVNAERVADTAWMKLYDKLNEAVVSGSMNVRFFNVAYESK